MNLDALPADRESLLQVWLKVLGRLDDGPVSWWFTGVTHGLTPDGGLQPLFRHENFSFGHYRRESERRHVSVMQDITFYRDLTTGDLLREFANPYTGETVAIDEVVTKDINNFYDLDAGFGFVADDNDIPQPFEVDVTRVDGLLWLTRAMDWALPNPLDPEKHANAFTGPQVRLQMETTVCVYEQPLTDPQTTSVATTSSYEAVTPWFPWLHMGGHEGYLITRAMGRKLENYAALPPEVQVAAEARFPGVLGGSVEPPASIDPWMGYVQRVSG